LTVGVAHGHIIVVFGGGDPVGGACADRAPARSTAGIASPMAFVFGYGSLVYDHREPFACRLAGYRRRWTVAMDNSLDIPGYKYFVDADSGERPRVFVTFLNIEPDRDSDVNGIAFEVSDAALAHLDERERNYARRDVTALVSENLGGRVYAFVGRPEARERCAGARRDGRAVVSRGYYEGVLRGFARNGDAALDAFRRSTDAPGCPIVALTRIDLP
jgi:cation transport regulator ChaC